MMVVVHSGAQVLREHLEQLVVPVASKAWMWTLPPSMKTTPLITAGDDRIGTTEIRGSPQWGAHQRHARTRSVRPLPEHVKLAVFGADVDHPSGHRRGREDDIVGLADPTRGSRMRRCPPRCRSPGVVTVCLGRYLNIGH